VTYSDIVIQSIAFRDDQIEVTYVEQREIADSAIQFRTLLFQSELVTEELTEVKDLVREIVDLVLAKMRQDPDRKPGRRLVP